MNGNFKNMKIIDAHFHYSKIKSFIEIANQNNINYSKEGFIEETKDNNVVAGICMGLIETSPGGFPDHNSVNPMLCDLAELPENFYYCAGINPLNIDNKTIKDIEKTCENPECAGLKIYAGYYHFDLVDEIYNPVYRLAEKFNLPVVIHSGDTFSKRGLLKYSHPLQVDELAVKRPELKIVIAHLGNPWLMDTAEVIYKNENVYTDLSGLQVGDQALFDRFSSQELYINMFKTALILADRYDKLIFGTDWPLAPLKTYIDFIKKIVPEKYYEDVFFHNALKLFQRITYKNLD